MFRWLRRSGLGAWALIVLCLHAACATGVPPRATVRGKSLQDIPAEDTVGDQLQEAVIKAAQEWGPQRLSPRERSAIKDALEKGEYWLARLLEREARGRYVHAKVEAQFRERFQFNHQGVDVVDLKNNRQYEILSGTASNLALHGRRLAGEFFRMLTF